MRSTVDFPSKDSGFTLIELLVVVLIIGVLAAMGLTQYSKTMEVARADDALAATKSIANANRMYALDHNGTYLSGNLSSCAPDGTSTTCNGTAASACDLLYCNYLARQDLRTTVDGGPKNYLFQAADGNAAGNVAATATRLDTADAPFNTWGFTVTRMGVAATRTGAVEQPPVH